MLNKGLYKYFDYAKKQLESGKTLDTIIDEIYDHEKKQTKQEAGIMPKRTLPKNIYPKGMKIGVTTKPTAGEMEIISEKDGEMDMSCHEGYVGAREKNAMFCRPKDMKDLE